MSWPMELKSTKPIIGHAELTGADTLQHFAGTSLPGGVARTRIPKLALATWHMPDAACFS